jgi:hypothetical protein
MSTRRQLIFPITAVVTATFYLVLLSTSSARATLSGDSHGSTPRILALALQDETCDEVDDATNDEACDEVNSQQAGEQESGGTHDTCQQSEEATDQDACEAVDQTTNDGTQTGVGSSTTNTDTGGDQGSNQNTSAVDQGSDQNAGGQGQSSGAGSKQASTEGSNPSGPLASAGRLVTQLTDGVAHLVGDLVSGVANLFDEGSGSSTKVSDTSENPGSASASGQSGDSASTTGAANSHEGDAPAPWWKAWLPNTGSEWLLFALVLAAILIGAGLALRSVGRHRRSGRAQVTS